MGEHERFQEWQARNPLYTKVLAGLALTAILGAVAASPSVVPSIPSSPIFWFVVGVVVPTVVFLVGRSRERKATQQEIAALEGKLGDAKAENAKRVAVGATVAHLCPPIKPGKETRLRLDIRLLGGVPYVGPNPEVDKFLVWITIPGILDHRVPLGRADRYFSYSEEDVSINAECHLDDDTVRAIFNAKLMTRFPFVLISEAQVAFGGLNVTRIRGEVPLTVIGSREQFPLG